MSQHRSVPSSDAELGTGPLDPEEPNFAKADLFGQISTQITSVKKISLTPVTTSASYLMRYRDAS